MCRDLDIYEIFRLRPTPSDLRRSGERGCQGCRLVWEGFREFYPLLDPENPQSVLTADDQVTLKIESSPEHGKGLHLIPVVSANVSERLSQSLHRIEFYLIEGTIISQLGAFCVYRISLLIHPKIGQKDRGARCGRQTTYAATRHRIYPSRPCNHGLQLALRPTNVAMMRPTPSFRRE